MPKLPEHRPAYMPDGPKRKPSGDQTVYKSKAWKSLRRIHMRAHPLCVACLEQGFLTDCTLPRAGVVDHIIAVSAGGARYDVRNLWTLCRDCHERKSKMEQHKQLDNVPTYTVEGELLPTEIAKTIILKKLTA